jgi:hypothetical protein
MGTVGVPFAFCRLFLDGEWGQPKSKSKSFIRPHLHKLISKVVLFREETISVAGFNLDEVRSHGCFSVAGCGGSADDPDLGSA